MALQVELKSGERIFIGESLITNMQERIRLYVEGSAPILRERDVFRAVQRSRLRGRSSRFA